MSLPIASTDLAIETRALSRRFGKVAAVSHLDLRVPRSSVYAFLGPNGAGKTTTIRMLLGLIRPNDGEVMIFGQSVRRYRIEIARRLGALVEMPSLYPHLTGRENLDITRRLLGVPCEEITRVLAVVNLEKDSSRQVRGYSLGMRQRLGLAIAMLGSPELLILDEPTNGLDPAGIHEMRTLIRRLPDEFGITVFLSSHLLGEVEQIASHIGIVENGRLLFEGPLNELQELKHECLIVGVDRPAVALELLEGSGLRVESSNNSHLTIHSASRSDAARINALLVREGLEVHHLSHNKPSLEDIFLNLTRPATGERNN